MLTRSTRRPWDMRVAAAALAAVLIGAGCSSVRTTDTPRGSVEELLLSTAADRAVAKLDVSALKGRKVFMDASQVDCIDKGYVIGALRDKLGRSGVLMVVDKKQADFILEARVGALATDSEKDLVGLPSMPVPLMGAGAVTTPELALYRKVAQNGQAKLALHAFDLKTGKQAMSTGAVKGAAFHIRQTILLTTWVRTNIPESQNAQTMKTRLLSDDTPRD